MNAETILSNFATSLEKERVAHAYLITGFLRRGSVPLAERMAQMVLCQDNHKGCGVCEACIKMPSKSHPDLVWIEPRMKSRRISIEDVRAVQDTIYQTSYMGSWKLCVVAGADRMADPAANALLKSLEEPPPRSMFILLAESPQHLLPTIISRCQRFDLTGSSGPEIHEWYADLMALIVGVGAGTVARMNLSYGLVNLLKGIKSGIEAAEEAEDNYSEDIDDKVFDARVSARFREERTSVMRMIVLWYRDLLILASGGDAGELYHKAYLTELEKESRSLSVRDATANIEAVEEMSELLEKNVGEDIVLLNGFTRISVA